jgi:hypothetical protein
VSVINGHTCIGDDGGTPNRPCEGCKTEAKDTTAVEYRKLWNDIQMAANERSVDSLMDATKAYFMWDAKRN